MDTEEALEALELLEEAFEGRIEEEETIILQEYIEDQNPVKGLLYLGNLLSLTDIEVSEKEYYELLEAYELIGLPTEKLKALEH